MTEQGVTPPPVPEPKGYLSVPGFVKSRPENNDHYIEQYQGTPYYDVLKNTHDALNLLVPGYNIGQIKFKFGELRYYVTLPENTSEVVRETVRHVIAIAAQRVDDVVKARTAGEL